MYCVTHALSWDSIGMMSFKLSTFLIVAVLWFSTIFEFAKGRWEPTCVCVCVEEREREKEYEILFRVKKKFKTFFTKQHFYHRSAVNQTSDRSPASSDNVRYS